MPFALLQTPTAKGYPPPTYTWYKESYENESIMARPINPLSDPRFTVSGGTLIINDPRQARTLLLSFSASSSPSSLGVV